LLEGAKSLLSRNNSLKLLLCAYHNNNDGPEIIELLSKFCFQTEYSKRYLLFSYDKYLEKPFLRRGLVRAMKI